ncbi:MAG: imidazole glycerol phosphate synthase subunit HisH [Promethearchaeota archaeon]
MVDITIIDYGMGNLRSIQKGLEKVGAKATLTSNKQEIKMAGALVLPGVGAFEDAMKNLVQSGISDLLGEKVDEGVPFLGICLGLQLLFEESTEGGLFKGLSLLPGRVDKFKELPGLKIPHMGWNELIIKDRGHFFLEDIKEATHVYFVHSYHAITGDENVVATAEYGTEFPAIVKNRAGNLVATQFHPEKSSTNGLKMLKNFVNFCKK